VDGKIYKNLSAGQKSIFGIEYKFRNAEKKTMFLDQPEDNLDNNTIATKILKLIKTNHQQYFIVTHNANIGILTNPTKVIVADIDNKNFNDKYKIQDPKNIKNNPKAFYLEGGYSYLESRFNIIKKEEKR
jgi:ABC-type taurine transport system ATPase subunit